MPIPLWMLAAGGGGALLNWLGNRSSQQEGNKAMTDAIAKAMAEIQGGKKESMGFLEPYLKNAPQDYNRYRGMVQSGYFGQGAPTSFNPQSFSFDPSQGSANFQTNSFAPLALPQYQPPQGHAPQTIPGPALSGGWQTAPVPQGQVQIANHLMNPQVSGMSMDPNSMIPQVGPNQWAGIPGTGIGMPQRQAEILRMLGIDEFGRRIPWTPKPGGLPNGSGPTVPMGPGGSPTFPGSFGRPSGYTPGGFSRGGYG